MKRILLTGAGGYIGQHMLDDLVARGYEVHAVSRRNDERPGDVTWHAADLLDPAASRALLANIKATHLMHLAWVTEPGAYWQSPQNKAWLNASRELLTSFVACGGSRAVLAGTCAEYDWSDGHCVEDVTPLRAKSLYAETKLAFREAAYALSADDNLEVAWARVFFSFGPHEQGKRLVPAVINALLAGDRAKCSDGSLVRDFMFVADVASAMTAVLDSKFCGDINIASGAPLTIADIVTHIAGKLDAVDRIDFGHYPREPDDPQKITADTSRLADAIGWTPAYDLDSAIDKTIEWWRDKAA